ncbi:hypothetical protein HF867_04530 [Lactobacillus salivarius]|uniref:hypothetical protein n=1 Tax=Ligilactobacillus salivarius TaxID=1624 RepID=UPI00147511D8|nr:hypothetical protein [Ligilactobacillus salivarius]NME24164.1 hypothetical protein [Ligilactobacillus salivarius]
MTATYIVYGNQENVLMLGTAKEVAEHLGIKIQSVYCLASKVKHGASCDFHSNLC